MSTKLKKKGKNTREVWMTLSSSTKVRMEIAEFKGQHRVDIREYVESEKYTGFTKKGINILTDKLEELYKGLGELLNTVKDENLINDIEDEDEEG